MGSVESSNLLSYFFLRQMCHFGDSQVISQIFANKLCSSIFLKTEITRGLSMRIFHLIRLKKTKQDPLGIYKGSSPPYCVYMGFLVRLLENFRLASGKEDSPLVKVSGLVFRISPGKRLWADLSVDLTSFPGPYSLTYLLSQV